MTVYFMVISASPALVRDARIQVRTFRRIRKGSKPSKRQNQERQDTGRTGPGAARRASGERFQEHQEPIRTQDDRFETFEAHNWASLWRDRGGERAR
jgi:hypothetical protein